MTEAMLKQLAEYALMHEKTGAYWGNRDQFWTRHRKILLWIDAELKRIGVKPFDFKFSDEKFAKPK